MTTEEARIVSDELIQQKLGYQLVRLQELLQGLSTDGTDPFACIVEAYSGDDVEKAAKQVLTGQSFPKSTAECDHCGRSPSEGVLYRSVDVVLLGCLPGTSMLSLVTLAT